MMDENNSNRMEISHYGSSLNEGNIESRNKAESEALIDQKDPVEAKKNDSKSQQSLQGEVANQKQSGSESQHTQLPQKRLPPPSLSCMMAPSVAPGKYQRFDAAEPRRADDQDDEAIIIKSLDECIEKQVMGQQDEFAETNIRKIKELIEKTQKLRSETEQLLIEIEGDLEDGITKHESKNDENDAKSFD